jgi:hypothetical protein
MNDNLLVFDVGFHKTGTSSLTVALKHLGYRVTGLKKERLPRVNQELVYKAAFELVDGGKYDAFKDNPWPIIYRELDSRYPNSKFILTIRSTKAWLTSVVRHFGTEETAMRTWIYGVGFPKGNEEIYMARYEQHKREVMAYFQERPDDLLVLNFAEEDGWEKLCPFLGHEIPEIPFPHANKGRVFGQGAKNKWW